MSETISALRDFTSYSRSEREIVLQYSSACTRYINLIESQRSAGQDDLGRQLRIEKARDFVDVVFAEKLATASTDQVCLYWSIKSEDRLRRALTAVFGESKQAAFAVFAYGKLGSRELNLSSDVDLVFVSRPGFEGEVTRNLPRFQELIAAVNEFGFCHRVDYDLRAGGRMGPVVATFEQWQDYFSNYGEAWERLTFIRLRPLWGASEIQKQVIEEAERLTFRRYLDFTMINSLKEVRQKIHAQNWMRSEGGRVDLKLGVGGIRDLELFIHTLQVVYGGRRAEVRTESTTKAIDQLALIEALAPADARFLKEHYWKLRHEENLVQGCDDQQTHLALSVPPEVSQGMVKCDRIVSQFFGPLDPKQRTLPESEDEQRDWLRSLGVSDAPIETDWLPLLKQEIFSRHRERDDRVLRQFLFNSLSYARHEGLNVDALLPRLRELHKRNRARTSFYHLLIHQPRVMERLTRLLSSSGYLSELLLYRPELLDSFVLERNLQTASSQDWEERLKIWRERKMLAELLSGLDFLQDLDVTKLRTRLSQVADAIVSEVLASLNPELQTDVQILALGSWGAGELGLGSDLDYVLIASDAVTQQEIKLGRRLANRLTGADPIYGVDLRLKPYASSGTLITSMPDLLSYILNEAPAWNRQAYLRARFLSGASAESIRQACLERGISADELQELKRIRSQLIAQAPKADIKAAAGGILDIELATQTFLLCNDLRVNGASQDAVFQAIEGSKYIKSEQNGVIGQLRQIYQDLRILEQFNRLRANADEVAASLKCTKKELEQRVNDNLSGACRILKDLDPRQTES